VVGSFAFAVTLGLLPQGLLVLVTWGIVVLRVVRPKLRPSLYRWASCIALAGSLAASLIVLFGLRLARSGVGLVAYGGSLVVDRFSVLCTIIFLVLALLTVLLSGSFTERISSRAAAFHALVLMATAAAVMMAAEREMIALFVGLQVLVVCMALLAALAKTDRRSGEAAFKYLVLSAAGSAVLLYGLAILYGVTGSTDLSSVAGAHAHAPVLTAIGVALTLLGLTVAVGALPLQHWLGQVAAGVPAAVAGFLTTVGVVAGLSAYLRVTVGGFGAGFRLWMQLVAVIAVITMLYAGLRALREHSLRELSGHLVLAQVGFMLVGLLSLAQGSDHRAGIVALLVYAMSFGVTTVALFGVMGALESAGLGRGTDDHRGLGHRAPSTALILAIVVAGLGGLPPLAIFVARLLILESAVAAGFAWVAVAAVVSSVLLAVGCGRFIVAMYGAGKDEARLSMAGTRRLGRFALALCATAAVAFSAMAQPLLAVSSGGAGTLPLH